MKILVVDDEKDVQLLFEQRFRKEIKAGEVEMAFAFSGEEALAYMQDHKQEAILILSDINMPGMSGLQLLQQIKEKYETPPPVVMMITAYGDDQNYQEALRLGADDFLTKPVDFFKSEGKTQVPYCMIKILVADDEEDMELLIRQKFRQKIREQAYDFVFAANGREALEQLDQHPDISIVLSDINMPEMDGLTLLSKLGEANPLVKTVMVSAYGDMENIRTAMNGGAFDFVTKPVNFEDLRVTVEKTIQHVNHLKESRKHARENAILRMYVDENVLDFMGGKEVDSALVQNEIVEGTVAFIDICGFTSFSENETPDRVVSLLNQYFDLMVKEIMAQDGMVDKFIGDCIMAVFKGDFHLDRAIDACLSIRNKIADLPLENSYGPQVAIGVNSGEMISGNVGSVTLKRLDYTVIGDTVNTAQRLQSAASGSQIVITERCFQQVKQSFSCKKLGPVILKNKAGETMLYEVVN